MIERTINNPANPQICRRWASIRERGLPQLLAGLRGGGCRKCDHLAMQAIHASLIREGTCVTSDCCDYCIVGDKNPMAAEYEMKQADNGLWISEKK